MITAIIPFYNQILYTKSLLDQIFKMKTKPDKIILIDDCSEELFDIKKYSSKLNIQYIKHKTNRGLNYSWNEGLNLSNTPLISVLNNDIILNEFFFDKIIEVQKENWGIVCPNKAKTIEMVNNENLPPKIIHLKKRQGWCWTIKKEVYNLIGKIPSFLRIYCGDDYIFLKSKNLGFENVMISNNYVYHYGGATVNSPVYAGLREQEKKLFLEHLKGKQW